MQGLLVIGGMLVVVIGLYILTYYINSKTEVPAGIEPASCSTCNSSTCSLRKDDGPVKLEDCEIEILN